MAAETQDRKPVHFGLVAFDGMQLLDAAGPLDALGILSRIHRVKLYIIANELRPFTTRYPPSQDTLGSGVGWSINPTHTFDAPPEELDFVLVPGGVSVRSPEVDIEPAVRFIKERYPRLQYLMSVCTGVGLLAQAGVLDGKRATGNKASWRWCTEQGPRTHWVAQARWVVDGNIWTTSGVSAGMDGFLAWIQQVFGQETVDRVANVQEYRRETDSSQDPFASKYGCTDVSPQST